MASSIFARNENVKYCTVCKLQFFKVYQLHDHAIVNVPMKKVLSIKQAINISNKLQKADKRVVLVGGCFDILHLGHVIFLEKAKKKGDILMVWIESDEMMRKHKGEKRPIHQQKYRAYVVAALSSVDYVVLLPYFTSNTNYDNLVRQLKPAIIATTKGDTEVVHKKRSAQAVGAKLVYVTNRIGQTSSSYLAELIAQES